MPKLAAYEDCTGCSACAAICPNRCISMREDAYGVTMPNIDLSHCVECKACYNICPSINPVQFRYPTKAYAAWNTVPTQRECSASGGIASAIYHLQKENSDCAIGAIMENDWKVSIIFLEKDDDYARCSNSKYCYSDSSNVYEKIRVALKFGQRIVLIGLPCQIAGYIKTFGYKDNLLYVDLVCHGVAPNSYLRQYIGYLENKLGTNIGGVSFRAPEKGTSNYYFTLYDKENNIIYSKRSSDGDLYNIAFHRGYSYRENCYNCHYARPERCSDITLGDYHGLGIISDCKFDNKNVSVILENSPRGKQLIEFLLNKGLIVSNERPIEEPILGDPQLRNPTVKNKERKDFEKLIIANKGMFVPTIKQVLSNKKRRERMDVIVAMPKRAATKLLKVCKIIRK